MTIGIYALTFTDGNMYIGQSTNIEQRINKHRYLLLNGIHCNYKVSACYAECGMPEYIVLELCSTSELISKEDQWMQEFDTLTNGLNLRNSEYTANHGPEHSQAKFSKEQVLSCFFLLLDAYVPYEEVARESGVSKGIVAMLACCKVHGWIEEEYPEEYALLQSLIGTRKSKQHSYQFKYPNLVSPDGVVHTNITNLKEFARLHNINYSHLHKVCRGNYGAKQTSGWYVQ